MPTNDGTGVSWVETLPANSDNRRDGAREIRDLRIGVAARLAKEHVDPDNASVGGEHSWGSAKVYFQTSTPTLRPDGTTALTAADYGRLYWDSDATAPLLKIYTASGWANIVSTGSLVTAMLADNAVTTVKIVDDAVTKAKIAADIAGLGLAQNVDGSLEVTTDGSTLEISSDTVRVKDAGITAAKLASDSVVTAKIADLAVTALKMAANSRFVFALYVGNGSTSGPTVTIGFQPSMVRVYDQNGGGDVYWAVNGETTFYRVDGGTSVVSALTFSSTGFTITTTNANLNTTGRTYLVEAIG